MKKLLDILNELNDDKKIFRAIDVLPECEKDFKNLSKRRFRTLPDDLKTFVDTALKSFHKLKIEQSGILSISNLGIGYPLIYKVRSFACKSLKGKGSQSGIRITYAYYSEDDHIEFIEIYFKQDKENEDRERIKKYYFKKIK